jgi:SHS2 domain-containing protein
MEFFEVLDISGDAGIRVFGKDLKELFVNAALGMFSLITDLKDVEEKEEINISVEGRTIEGTLVSWLNELIFRFDTYGFIVKNIIIAEFLSGKDQPEGETYTFTASISGEQFDPERHKGKLLIKAATYHKLTIEKKGSLWRVEVIFDI